MKEDSQPTCNPSPLRLDLRLFVWSRLLHGASRPTSSARLHLYYLFCLQIFFTGCMYVTIIDESSPCMPFVILDFTAASCFLYGCGHDTSKPSQSARFNCDILFWFYISILCTHETHEDSVLSARRTLESHEDSAVSVL